MKEIFGKATESRSVVNRLGVTAEEIDVLGHWDLT